MSDTVIMLKSDYAKLLRRAEKAEKECDELTADMIRRTDELAGLVDHLWGWIVRTRAALNNEKASHAQR